MAKRSEELFETVRDWVGKWAPAQDVILDTSWAVWKEPSSGGFSKFSDVSFPGETVARERAHARVIVLAMNPGNDQSRGDWSNFHHSWVSRDQLLAEACRDTGLEGSLMTDLYFDQFQSDSSMLEVSGAGVGAERILDIIRLSEEPDPLIVCLGGKTYKGFRDGLEELRLTGRDVPEKVSCVRVTHYSGSAAGKHKHQPELYRSIVHAEIKAAGFGGYLSPEMQPGRP